MDLLFKSISDMSSLIKKREISPVELIELELKRIEQTDQALNAFIRVMEQDAKEQARLLELELQHEKIRGPLHGIPVAIKDIFETKGIITTAGSKVLSQWVPNKDATVVMRLKKAGAIIIGKTNLHEFAMGATTENPHYGPTRNPWNLKKIPGGSSGGSAAAVAAGMCYGALGTDTGGSIRLPSSLCGIVGLKPTFNLVDRQGCVPLSWSLDHIGPMARTVDDCALILAALLEPEKLSGLHLDITLKHIHEMNIKNVKIGICRDYFFENIEDSIQKVIDRAVEDFEGMGLQFKEVSIAGIDEAIQAQKIISKSESYAFHQKTFEKYRSDYGEDVRYRLDLGSKVSASDYINAQRIRKKFVLNVKKTMDSCDILFSPTHAITPFDIGQRDPEESMNNIFNLGKTPIGNLLGFPILTVPCGFSSKKMPVGMQLIGKPYSEVLLLAIGKKYEYAHHWVDSFEDNHAYTKIKL